MSQLQKSFRNNQYSTNRSVPIKSQSTEIQNQNWINNLSDQGVGYQKTVHQVGMNEEPLKFGTPQSGIQCEPQIMHEYNTTSNTQPKAFAQPDNMTKDCIQQNKKNMINIDSSNRSMGYNNELCSNSLHDLCLSKQLLNSIGDQTLETEKRSNMFCNNHNDMHMRHYQMENIGIPSSQPTSSNNVIPTIERHKLDSINNSNRSNIQRAKLNTMINNPVNQKEREYIATNRRQNTPIDYVQTYPMENKNICITPEYDNLCNKTLMNNENKFNNQIQKDLNLPRVQGTHHAIYINSVQQPDNCLEQKKQTQQPSNANVPKDKVSQCMPNRGPTSDSRSNYIIGKKPQEPPWWVKNCKKTILLDDYPDTLQSSKVTISPKNSISVNELSPKLDSNLSVFNSEIEAKAKQQGSRKEPSKPKETPPIVQKAQPVDPKVPPVDPNAKPKRKYTKRTPDEREMMRLHKMLLQELKKQDEPKKPRKKYTYSQATLEKRKQATMLKNSRAGGRSECGINGSIANNPYINDVNQELRDNQQSLVNSLVGEQSDNKYLKLLHQLNNTDEPKEIYGLNVKLSDFDGFPKKT